MKLAWMKVTAYRRFLETQTLGINGKLTALVGRNEAGKTSILHALQRLGDDEVLDRLDRTRGAGSVSTLIEAAFFLEPEDHAELKGLNGGHRVRLFRIAKDGEGTRRFSIEPTISRDVGPRVTLAERIRRVLGHRLIKRKLGSDPEFSVDPLQAVLDILESAKENLSPDSLKVIRQAASLFSTDSIDDAPQYITSLPQALRQLASLEQEANPTDLAVDLLKARVPAFALFDEDNRRLQSSYELSEVRKRPPVALKNLTSAADLNLGELWGAVRENDHAEVNTIETRANATLAEHVQAWSQSGVQVELRVDGETLLVQIRDEENRFSGFDERSDGLRQFVALLTFCMSRRVKDPVLLIDEAESHLHYDAQADLVDVLSRQPIARQVIYTTHSLGCLPEDLGSGVKLVAPATDDQTRSVIKNRFWVDNEPGFWSILFGMGATTLAFLPVRAALLVEGPSDHILLPHILRSSLEQDHLGFQVVPGLSSSSREQIPVLKGHGSRVLYLVDNDDGGDALSLWLRNQGIESSDILRLAHRNSTVHEVEDLIDERVFVDAVNAYLSKWHEGDASFERDQLPVNGRYEALEDWCGRVGCPLPGKVDLAYEILECSEGTTDAQIVDKDRLSIVERLARKVSDTFKELTEQHPPRDLTLGG